MNRFAEIVNEKREKLDKANMERQLKEEIAFRKRCEELEPLLNKLNDGINSVGLSGHVKFVLHTDKKHFPCPAIHVDRSSKFRLTLYNYFGEIYKGTNEKKEVTWKTGACNGHNYHHKTEEEVLDFVAETVADKCFKRKNLA